MRFFRLLAVVIIAFAVLPLHASDELVYFIQNADDATIAGMASVRGLDASLPAGELRRQLLQSEDLESAVVDLTAQGEGDYSLQIINADSMDISQDGLVNLSGNVEIGFTLASDEAGKTLRAQHMLLDPASGRLTAYGGVQYSDSQEGSGLENISADIVTYLYESGDLLVSGGTTSTERTTNESETVTFYTTGELLNYRSADGGLFFSDGYLTSDPDRAYSSITAGTLALLDGGDMFMTNAYLSIGRVPLLYLPFFFYPGSRLSINPAFGFSSSRGMFLSTTTEVFGSYPGFSTADESSFSSILRPSSDASMVSNGLYYEEGEPSGGLQGWAADTESYLALFADVYQHSGFMLGFDTSLRPLSSLTLSSQSSVVLSPSTSYFDGNWRWYTVNRLSYTSSSGSLSLSLPLYSDPYVLREYGNRLTSLSIDALFGASQTFPSTVSNTVNSYNAQLSGSFSLPGTHTNDYVSSLRLSSIRANASFDWNSTQQKYIISDITLPSLNFSMSGSLFRLSSSASSSAKTQEDTVTVSDYFVLSDPMLYDLYVLEPRRQGMSANTEYSFSLSYTLTQRLSNTFELDQDTLKPYDQEFTSDSSVRFDIDTVLASWFTMTQSFTPSLSYDYDESNDEQKESGFSMLSTTRASLPFIGLSYEFSAYLYSWNRIEDLSGSTSEEDYYSFDRDNVRSHSLTLSKSFGSADSFGQITPSLRYTLPPLSSSIEPRLGYRLGGLTASFGWVFKENSGSGKYESGDISLSLGLMYTHFTFNLSMTYESAMEKSRMLDPLSLETSLSLRTADRRWSVTEYVEYDAYDSGLLHQFDSIRTVFSIPYLDFTVNFSSQDGGIGLEYVQLSSQIDRLDLYTWKNRIHLSLVLDGSLRYDFMNPYSSSLRIRTGLSFSIAEFLDLTVSLTTTNNGFYRYVDGNGVFSFQSMWSDLLRSFDFIGDGRMNTQFNMESLDVELVHYMGDWDLHLRYMASLQSSGSDYGWVPTFAVYLRWRTIPDLKVDQTWEQNLSTGEWHSGDSLYAD